MKNREVDLRIVVNMFLTIFLTGFDATTLNTLWVDKNLRYHGLLQAYSRNNRELIRNFIDRHTPENDVHDCWHEFVRQSHQQIEQFIAEENLRCKQTLDFMAQSFREAGVKESGTAIAEILPPMSLFGSAGAKRTEKKKNVISRLKEFFDPFYDISGSEFYRLE